ncbi:hypothetical protein K3495_g6957 [Podosphaera aphanis]|nr:hypothetical protein K3495_g6957 [Podosphaera aphanis]
MPITTLIERETNADKSDKFFTPNDMSGFRSIYKHGDIVDVDVDVDAPSVARPKESSYSKSTSRGVSKGTKLEE